MVWFGRVTPGTRRYGVDMPTTRTGAANPYEPGVTTGVTGHPWRASVSASGAIEPWDRDQEPVRWYVAADDRWHDPAEETAVRQIRIDGTPVIETRLRIPDGDAVQRVAVGDPQPGLGHRRAVDADLPHGSLLGRNMPAVVGRDVPPDGFLVAIPRLDVTGRGHRRPPGMTRDPGGHAWL